jgi:hypothetical protein
VGSVNRLMKNQICICPYNQGRSGKKKRNPAEE